MSMPAGIEGVGFAPLAAPRVGDVTPLGGPSAPQGPKATGFGDMVIDNLDKLERVQDTADQLSVRAATGDSASIHGYMLAATEASVTTQVTVAARNRALEAFTEIMRLPIG